MIPVVYPRSVNWFYHAQAHAMAADLTAVGVPARAVASDRPTDLEEFERETVLLVCFAELLIAAERQNRATRLLDVLKTFRRRILVNFDSVRSSWFSRHFDERPGYFSDIFDFGLYRQSGQPTIMGIPYHFVSESLAREERAAMVAWSPGRLLPWTILGHATRDRSALIEAVLRSMPKNGFVFSPPLRPFTERSGLNRAAITRILRQTDLYVWGSHHLYPYHETQRVLHAVTAGAIPVKIDPLHSHRVNLPWVYPSVEAMLAARDRFGLEELYAATLRHVEAQGGLGENLRATLEAIGAVARPARGDAA